MQEREKKLAVLFVGVLGFALLLPVLEGWFLQPVTEQRGLLEAARMKLAEREERKVELYQAQSNLRDWRYESLPPTPQTAQREYREWLLDLTAMCDFVDVVTTLQNRQSRGGGTYWEIPVQITARATLESVARFLYHCERVALLHRISALELTSPTSDGNPLLEVELTATGISVSDAPYRQHLFSRTTLKSDVTPENTTIEIEPVQGFPLVAGFQIKLDQELATVRKLDGATWTIERGVENTLAAAHTAGSDVELFPLDRGRDPESFEQYRSLLENSPFTTPAPPMEYKPEFSPATLPVVIRGTPWEVKLAVTGWDPSGGRPVFSLGETAPEGMKLDAETGKLTWNPDAAVPAGQFEVPLRAVSRINSDQSLSATLPLTLREPNLPPVVEAVEPVKAYSGRPIRVHIVASDPDGEVSGLSYSLTGNVPAGAKIDGKTGELTWTPPLTMELGDYPITVAVTDKGDPPQTVSVNVPVTVVEDTALFTKYSGNFVVNGEAAAYLYNPATDESTYVQLGDHVQVADISGTVIRIERDYLDLEIASQTFRLPLAKSFRQLLPVDEGSTQSSEED